MSDACSSCGKKRQDVKQLVEMSQGHFTACNECIELCADIIGITSRGQTMKRARGIFERRDIKDITLPETTKEFAQWLRDVATQVDRIPDRPLQMSEDDVEVGFYYGNLVFPQMPTGLHFAVDFASTEALDGR